MSGVVLRCPHCGTTRSSQGECEGCHEAQVRYFCSNHSPGRWLESAVCVGCGARFGDPVRTPVAPPPAAAPPPSRPRPQSPGLGRPRSHGPFTPPPAPREEDAPTPGRARGPVTFEDLLEAAARRRGGYEGVRPEVDPRRTPRIAVPRLGGCLVKAIMIVVFFIFAIMSGLFMFTGSMFRMF